MTNKERLEANNAKIDEITKTLAKKQVSPNDMLQQLVDKKKYCTGLFSYYDGENMDFIYGLDTSNVVNMTKMFENCDELTGLDLSNFKTDSVTKMEGMFWNCQKLTSLDLSSFNTSNVTTMANMFVNCYDLPNLDLSSFDTGKVTTFSGMFSGCNKLVNIRGLTNFNTSNATDMSGMFRGCYILPSLDLSHFNTSKVTDIGNMFSKCVSLTSLDLSSFDMSKVTSAYTMFEQCKSLKSLDFSHTTTSKITNMNSMFNGCAELETVIGLDMYSASAAQSVWANCPKITNLMIKNIRYNLQLGSGTTYGHLLTDESLINTFKELWNLTGSSSKTLTLSTTSNARTEQIYVKLVDVTDEMLAQDQYAGNKKPCVVCEPTDEGAMTLKEYGISKNWSIA